MTHVLVRGTKSETVSTLKYWLNLVVLPAPNLTANREFDQPTFDAVVKFQIAQGLHHDGKVGADTWGRLAAGRSAEPWVRCGSSRDEAIKITEAEYRKMADEIINHLPKAGVVIHDADIRKIVEEV